MEFKRTFGKRFIQKRALIDFGGRILLGVVITLLIGIGIVLILYGSGHPVIGGWVILTTLVGLGLVGFFVCRK